MTHCISFLAAVLLSFPAIAQLEFDSAQLMMKNSDQVNDLIRKKIKIAEDAQASQKNDEEEDEISAQPEAIAALKDAMRIALSRPDQDGAREGMFATVRRELVDLGSTDAVLKELADEGVEHLKSEHPPKVQATYITLLENLMAELKPDLANNPSSRKVIENIRDAKIKISSKVQSQQLLQSMKKQVSPSETAQKLLEATDKDKKKK